jgi:hypothetical protein
MRCRRRDDCRARESLREGRVRGRVIAMTGFAVAVTLIASVGWIGLSRLVHRLTRELVREVLGE